MTRNQIAYNQLLEDTRSHKANETETNRSNLAKEAETHRSNLAGEVETNRANIAREKENYRSNKAKEKATNYANKETKRHNKATEKLDKYRTDKQSSTSLAVGQIQAEASKYGADQAAAASKYAADSSYAASKYQADTNAATQKEVATLNAITNKYINYEKNRTEVTKAQIQADTQKAIKQVDVAIAEAELKQKDRQLSSQERQTYAKIIADLKKHRNDIVLAERRLRFDKNKLIVDTGVKMFDSWMKAIGGAAGSVGKILMK